MRPGASLVSIPWEISHPSSSHFRSRFALVFTGLQYLLPGRRYLLANGFWCVKYARPFLAFHQHVERQLGQSTDPEYPILQERNTRIVCTLHLRLHLTNLVADE